MDRMFKLICAGVPALLSTLMLPPGAQAQSLVALVNGAAITSSDLDARMKFLRGEHQPASRDAAMESMISDLIKLQEMKSLSVSVGQGDINQAIIDAAKASGMAMPVFSQSMQRAGVSASSLTDHWRAEAGFAYIVRARNKMIEPSNAEIDAALAAKGGAPQTTDFKLMQIVFTLPANAPVALVNARGHEAQSLRAKFTDCDSGTKMARDSNDVAIKQPVTRNSIGMDAGLLKILEATPEGHLTPPQRDAEGIIAIAVCSKTTSKNQDVARTAIAAEITAKRLKGDIARRYAELRKRAIIQRR